MGPKGAPCGNPLWAGWVHELSVEMQEKGSKSSHAYGKAAKALKSCPIPFDHPEQAIELVGVGPGIISFLCSKLEKHCAENGLLMPARVGGSSRAPKLSAKKRGADEDDPEGDARREARRLKTKNGGLEADHNALIPSNSASGTASVSAASKKAPAKRAYVPKERSGAYAILLGLYTKSEYDDRTAWTLKSELVRLAAPHTDTPFDKATTSAGGGVQASSGWHTAWSSSKLLIEKGLVLKDNKSPAHYALSEEGWELADKLARAAGIPVHEPTGSPAPHHRPPSNSPASFERRQPIASTSKAAARPTYTLLSDEDDVVIDEPIARPQPGQLPTPTERERAANAASARLASSPTKEKDKARAAAPFEYHYLNEEDERVSSREEAEQGQEAVSLKPLYRIEYRKSCDGHKMARALIGREDFSRETMQGFLRQRVALETCPGFTERAPSPVKTTAATLRSSALSHSLSAPSVVRPHSPPRPAPPKSSSTSRQAPLVTSFDVLNHISTAPSDRSRPVINRHPLDPVRDHVAPPGWQPPQFTPEIWPAGSYTISLVIDTRESGLRKSNRKEIVEMLRKLDPTLDVEQRMLPLGDMLWIAKKNLSSGGRPGIDEVVLDCVVERKRLDDLCSSIRDGRYLTQKARMKDSAISDRVYLVEKYDASANYAQWGKMIWTAKSQLQVNDGFHLFEALNLADTCNYLKNKTNVLKECHQGSSIYAIPDGVIDRQTYLALQRHLRSTHPDRAYLTTYASYGALNSSEAGLTLRAQWGGMVQRIKGVSAEKAVQLIERWPTPVSFWEDVDRERRRREARGEVVPAKKMGDWVGEQLAVEGRVSVRGLKGVLGGRVWQLFAAKGKYDE